MPWVILAFIGLACAFGWLAYQLWQGGKSNATLQTELRETRIALAETNRKNLALQKKLSETDAKLDSCTTALNNQ